MDTLRQDIRYGIRALLTHRTFAAAAVLTLALGVGANAAIFTICRAVLFRPLPYTQPEQLVMLWERPAAEGALQGAAPANFVDWRTRSTSFDQLAAVNPSTGFTLTGAGVPERIAGASVSSSFFPLLGTRMAIGRNFLPDEEQPGRHQVVILSHGFWQRVYAGRRDVVGRTLTLNDATFTIAGVLPSEFEFVGRREDFGGLNRFDVWVPLVVDMQRLQRGTHPWRVFGRLRNGVGAGAAQAELDVIAEVLGREYPSTNRNRSVVVVPLSEQITAGMRAPLLTLLAAVGLVWLIACVNVANLLLTRAAARHHEMSVRVALGASRLRLGRQLVTESVVLTSAAAVAGTALAWGLLRLLELQLPFDLPRAGEIRMDAHVAGFIATLSFAAAVVFGCAPLVRRVDAGDSLRERRPTASRGQRRVRSALVIGQIALACMLLVGAGLMGRSLWELLNVAPGFEAHQILTAQMSLVSSRYPTVDRIAAFQQDTLTRIRNLPGVQSAGAGGYLPLGGTDNSWAPTIEGRVPLGPGNDIQYRPATPGYIETMGIPLLRGRHFNAADNARAPAVAIVNEAAARRYWPGEDPIGRRLQIDGGPPWRTVVGVLSDVRHQGLDMAAKPELYLPFAQLPYPSSAMTLVIRTAGDPLGRAADVRQALAGIDANVPLSRVQTMDEVVSASVGGPKFRAMLISAFALLALLLASIGVYAVMSALAGERTPEFGVRAALGATHGDLLRLMLQQSIGLIACGLGIGMFGAIALAHVVKNLLFGVAPYDVMTLAAVSALLTLVALLASYVPARRAARIDPLIALRYE